MARTALTKTTAPGCYVPTFTEVTMNAADVANGNYFVMTGRELLVMRNSSADTDYYVTIDSVDDPFGRQEDITQVDIGFGDVVVWGPVQLEGWRQSTGWLHINAENAAILIGVIVLP